MAVWTISAASESSRGSTCDALSNRVTRLPKRAKVCAISQPIGPPPMTPSRGGSSVRVKKSSLVKKSISSSPGIGGANGRAPEATTARRNRSRLPPTSTASLATNRPSPMNTSTPRPANRLALS